MVTMVVWTVKEAMKPFDNDAVSETFAGYPPRIRRKLLGLRSLIFEVAAATDGVGELEETLKWGEPAYRSASLPRSPTIVARRSRADVDFSRGQVFVRSSDSLSAG